MPARTRSSSLGAVLPAHYLLLFLMIEPAMMLCLITAMVKKPQDFYKSLAPNSSNGLLFPSKSAFSRSCSYSSAYNSPQIRVLVQQFMGALAFKAMAECLLLYTARYRMQTARDAQSVITVTLIALGVLDLMHSGATISITGQRHVVPGLGQKPWKHVDVYTAAHGLMPLAWLSLRLLWLGGFGRQVVRERQD